MVPSNQWIMEYILKTRKQTKKPTATKNLWEAAKAILRGDFIVIQAYLGWEWGRKISNKQPKLTCKGTRKRKTSKTQSQ